jgi:tetratricopeptide (TPR) repeat protein
MRSKTLTVLVLALSVLSGTQAIGGERRQKPVEDLFDQAKARAVREDWREALSRFREFVSAHSDDPRAVEARFWIGCCLVKSDEFDEAVRELEPFEAALAKDPWADDALLQLGHAYRGQEQEDLALAVWKRLLEKFPDSVCRTEAAMQIIDVLYAAKDYAACLPDCERAVRDAADFSRTTEARYVGAYCLGALSRYDEADQWMNRYFSATDANEAGWRRILSAQRELRQGHVDQAIAGIGAIDADFPDLGQEGRLDLTLRAATMLSRENQAKRAREILSAALAHSAGHSEDEIEALLDHLEEAASDGEPFSELLSRLAADATLPLLARLVVRERHVERLREEDHVDAAEAILSEALTKEKTEYARYRVAALLAEVLSDDREDREGASKVLNELLPTLKRADLVHRVRAAIETLEAPGDGSKD